MSATPEENITRILIQYDGDDKSKLVETYLLCLSEGISEIGNYNLSLLYKAFFSTYINHYTVSNEKYSIKSRELYNSFKAWLKKYNINDDIIDNISDFKMSALMKECGYESVRKSDGIVWKNIKLRNSDCYSNAMFLLWVIGCDKNIFGINKIKEHLSSNLAFLANKFTETYEREKIKYVGNYIYEMESSRCLPDIQKLIKLDFDSKNIEYLSSTDDYLFVKIGDFTRMMPMKYIINNNSDLSEFMESWVFSWSKYITYGKYSVGIKCSRDSKEYYKNVQIITKNIDLIDSQRHTIVCSGFNTLYRDICTFYGKEKKEFIKFEVQYDGHINGIYILSNGNIKISDIEIFKVVLSGHCTWNYDGEMLELICKQVSKNMIYFPFNTELDRKKANLDTAIPAFYIDSLQVYIKTDIELDCILTNGIKATDTSKDIMQYMEF